MKRKLFTMLLAMIVSATTTMGILMRYSNITLSDISKLAKAESTWTNDNDSYAIINQQESRKYVDMEKLSKDMNYISATVSNVNEFISEQINKICDENVTDQG